MSALDEMIDTWEDWEELVTGFRERDIDQLLIIDDVDASDNPIIMRSHDLVLGAYSWLFGDAGFGNLVVRLDDRSLDE